MRQKEVPVARPIVLAGIHLTVILSADFTARPLQKYRKRCMFRSSLAK